MRLPQGFGSLSNSLLRLWETPYTTLLIFPAYPASRTLCNPARAGISLWLGRFHTTFRTLVTQCVRHARTDSLTRQLSVTSSDVLYRHPIHRNHTIYTLYSINMRYNSISGLYDYFKAQHFILHNKHVCSSQVHVRLNNPPCHRRRPPPVRRQLPTTITRGC